MRPHLGLLLLVLGSLGATEYGVAPPPLGDDANDGRNRPFATIAKAMSRLNSGDTLLLARGGLFREASGNFPNGVTVKAGGDPSLPVPIITPSLVVTGWKPSAKNPKILSVPVDKPIRDLYVNGKFQPLARYPNAGQGWLRTGSGTSPDSIACTDRAKVPGAAAGRWNGGQVRWRRWSWWWEVRPITADDGSSRLSLGPENKFQDPFCGDGSAFIVDNLLCELDAPGEWFWDKDAKQLLLIPPAGADPKTMLVEVTIDSKGWTMGSATLDGIGFARFGGSALSLSHKSTVTNCLFQDISTDAIGGSFEAGGSLISGNTFRDVRNIAIGWMENPNGAGGTIIERNRMERIGMEFGHGGSGSWHLAGVLIINGKAVTCRYNTLIDIGYAGFLIGGDGQIVERNIMVRCMGSLNDGGGIYANSSKGRFHENIILDTVGNLETSQYWYPLGHGIWPEFLSNFREQSIVGNTIFGSGGNGIFLTNNYECEIRENVLVGNRLGQLELEPGESNKSAQKHVIADNILVAQLPSRRIPHVEQIPSNWTGNDAPAGVTYQPNVDYGKMTGTIFILSPGTSAMRGGGKRWDDIGSWKLELPWADQAARGARMASLLLINDTEEEKPMVPPGGGWRGTDGKPIPAKGVVIKPYRSVVVVREGREEGLPPYLCASGTDWRAEPLAPQVADKSGKGKGKGKGKTGKADDTAGAKTDEPAAAQPATAGISATPTPEALKAWTQRLRDRTVELVKQGKGPQFTYSAFKATVTIESFDGDTATLIMAGAGTMSANLFSKLKPEDACAMSLAIARSNTAADHALAAFFARCAGNAPAYAEHLARAETAAAEIEAAFPAAAKPAAPAPAPAQ